MYEEALFWIGFILINAVLYLPNYLLNISSSFFLPYVKEFVTTRKLGLTMSSNLDAFRYEVFLSIGMLSARFVSSDFIENTLVVYFFLMLVFNIYQYSFRKIYEYEPNFFNDLKLIKNGFAIVWNEGKIKLLITLFLVGALMFFLSKVVLKFFEFTNSLELNFAFYVIGTFWAIPLIKSLFQSGLYKNYPNDAHLRYHFGLVEIYKNIQRSITNSKIAKARLGAKVLERRRVEDFELIEQPPNLHIIFIESYGSFYYLNEAKKALADKAYKQFQNSLSQKQWQSVSNFSESPTLGGQSWLTYSTFLYGIKIKNNTYFENFLHDTDFSQSDSLLKIFRDHGYYNFNLNPIKPIKQIQVPYEQMRTFYCIDEWILNESLNFKGDTYGFGKSPPDQYSLNFAMEKISLQEKKPYTFFYLTQSSHTPFISPAMVQDWESLSSSDGRQHYHEGFLKQPATEDYYIAIKYQLDVLQEVILKWGRDNDIFLLMGDHQPPVLSNYDKYGLYTPVHIISKKESFLRGFQEYGFERDIMQCRQFVKHESMYSIFLREFIKNYSKSYTKLPPYEPDGLQL